MLEIFDESTRDAEAQRLESPSLIANFIRNNSNWKEELEAKAINVKEDGEFVIFNYGIGCNFADKIVQEARGVILDKNSLEVACFPFRKFGNYHEPYADKIDWSTARVQEKIDGSIIKLFFNKYNGEWQWATNSTIDAQKATIQSMFSENFLEVIKKADNYKDIPFESLKKDTTYIFELTGPENKVVVRYPKTHLYHIGTRSNRTGEERIADIGIERPKEYSLKSFDEALEAVKHLNNAEDTMHAEHEGFVVVDGNWNRIKIKSPEYLMLHHFTNGVLLNKSKIISLLESDDINLNELETQFPEYRPVLDFYKEDRERVLKEAEEYVNKVRNLYSETGSRKEVALKIKDDQMSNLGFKSLGNNKSARELLAELPQNAYENLFRDFVPEEELA